MGQMTRADIVSEALELAGNTGLTPRANVWLNLWLQRAFARWPWPFLQNHYGPYSVVAGAEKLTVGNGEQTDNKLHIIRRALLIDPTTGVLNRELEIKSSAHLPASEFSSAQSATNLGEPRALHIQPVAATPFQWDLFFAPRPSQALRVVIVAHYIPDDIDIDEDGDAVVPIYPVDETMVQAVFARALKHQGDDRWQAEEATLARMVGEDRSSFGGAADMAGPRLSQTRFSQGRSARNWLTEP